MFEFFCIKLACFISQNVIQICFQNRHLNYTFMRSHHQSRTSRSSRVMLGMAVHKPALMSVPETKQKDTG